MMIKPELVRNIVNKFEVGESEAALFVDNIFVSMSDALRKGKNINIPEFGKFKINSKTTGGTKQRYVSFSPVRQFADSVNDNFNNLEPQITKAINLKNNEILTIRELMADENDEDYLCFIFDDEPETQVSADIPPDIISVSDTKITEYISAEKTSDESSEVISEDSGLKSSSFIEEQADSETAFELPDLRRKIIHDLKDDFSIEDIDNEITGFILKRDEILNELDSPGTSSTVEEALTSPETELSEDDIIIPSSDDILIPLESADDKQIRMDKTSVPEDITGEFSEDSDKQLIPETNNVELRVFQRLLLDQPYEQKEDVVLKETVHEADVKSFHEPASLTEALDKLQTDNVIKYLDKENNIEAKSFEEVFVNNEPQYGIKPAIPEEKKKPRGVFMKVVIYTFLIVFAVGISFILYKTLFEKQESTRIIENLNLQKPDSLKNQFTADENVKGESVLIEDNSGLIFRRIDSFIYIENNVCKNIGEASDKEAKLNSNLVSSRIEAYMTLENSIQYRVLVGPFVSLEKAKQYYEENKSVLNSVK
ncbi:MAG: HU family DNA-binding protein [Candidatus Kapaibacterium sp.]